MTQKSSRPLFLFKALIVNKLVNNLYGYMSDILQDMINLQHESDKTIERQVQTVCAESGNADPPISGRDDCIESSSAHS